MSARDVIAAALEAVPDPAHPGKQLVNISPYYRQSLKAGDGFVKFQQRVRSADRFGYMDTWQVWIAVPQDLKTAEQWLDTNLGALVAAFVAPCALISVTPAELLLGTNSVNGVILEGVRAAD